MNVLQKIHFLQLYQNPEKYVLKQLTKMRLSSLQAYQECKYCPLNHFLKEYQQGNKKRKLELLKQNLQLANEQLEQVDLIFSLQYNNLYIRNKPYCYGVSADVHTDRQILFVLGGNTLKINFLRRLFT